MSEIINAFAVPILSLNHEQPEQLNKALRELFLEFEKDQEKYGNPEPFVVRNKALFESKFTLFDWPYEPIRELRDFCYGTVYGLIRDLNGYDTATLQRLHIAAESWFHVTRRGGYFGAHTHPLHSWSGVYCVKHDGDDPESNSGRLSFINPNVGATAYTDMATARMREPFTMSEKRIRMKPGQLLVFPSWLLHEVHPYEGDSERITVAFNCRFKMVGVESKHTL